MKAPDSITVDVLPNIVDVALMRNVQPDDVLVLTVPKWTTPQTAADIAQAARRALPCRVIVVTEDVTLAEFSGDVS